MISGYESSYLEDKNDENMSMIDFFVCLFWYYFIILRIRLIYAFYLKYMSSLIYKRIRHVNINS